MKRSLRRTRVLGVALAATLLAAGCSSGSNSAAPLPLEKRVLTVAAVPALDSVGLYIAQMRGFFAQEGLTVHIVQAVSGETILTDQARGKYDVSIGNYVSYFADDALRHADFRILAAASLMAPHNQELLIPANSKVVSLSQLLGKKIAVNALNNIGTLLLDSIFNDNGLPSPGQPGGPVLTDKFPFPAMAEALQKGRVAAAWMPEPFITQSELTAGATQLEDLNQGSIGNLPIAGYMVTQRWLKKNPGTAEAFYRAIERGQAVASQNLAAVREGMYKWALLPNLPPNVPHNAAVAGAKQISEMAAESQYPEVTDPRVLQRVADLMLYFSMLKERFNVASIIVPFAKK